MPLAPRRHRTLRHALQLRAIRIWWPRWRRRALFLFGGIVVGGLAAEMIRDMLNWFEQRNVAHAPDERTIKQKIKIV